MDQFAYLLQIPEQKLLSPEISDMFKNINDLQNQLDHISQKKQQQAEDLLLKAFKNSIVIIGKQLLQVKQKYNQINKVQLIEEKQIMLTTKIHKYREQTLKMNEELKKVNKEIKRIQQQNIDREFQNDCLKLAIKNKQVTSRRSKNSFLTQMEDKKRFSQPSFQTFEQSKSLKKMKKSKQKKHQYTMGVPTGQIARIEPHSKPQFLSIRTKCSSFRRQYMNVKSLASKRLFE